MKLNYEQLRYAAFRQRLSGREIARISGMSPATVCNILRGSQEPSATNLYRMCRVLGLPMELCFVDDRETPGSVAESGNAQNGK
jgi:transcriptional regulator with XRE-family HTH domain